ncbi:peptidoglycan-binding protein [Streptomyces violaceusniger]|uniref:peptidoglycan-binding protein n=1 Tax=Streptomyces violaceusniger TaxID=68280 RepID=UPI0020736316|nr:peptidoglycan-binding protein [Streptomyces violaceusniger]
MSRWKAFPDSLDDRVQQLVVQLRRLKDRSGLSLSSMASKTGYSRSSWERYLNGKALAPREAVEALARVCGVGTARLLVLHELAEEAWRMEDAATAAADIPTRGGARRAVLIGVLTTVLLGALVVGLLVAAPWSDHGNSGKGTAATAHGVFAYQPGKTYPCAVRRKNGQLYAGYSTTRTAVLSRPGWDVVEAQCLLDHLGFDPGGVDGVDGEMTTRAVKRLQEKAGLATDGLVGPQTWKVLRG